MANGFGSRLGREGSGSRTLGAAMRSAGRLALWAAVALLLVRGAADLLGPSEEARPPSREGGGAGDPAASAFAIRFVRDLPRRSLSWKRFGPFLAAGAHIPTGRPPSAQGAGVAQAEVLHEANLGDGRTVLTVACELRDSRTLYLAVPIVRFRAGEVERALGAPSIVAVPGGGWGRPRAAPSRWP